MNIQTGGKKTVSKLRPGLDNLAFDGHVRLFVSSTIDGNIWEVYPEANHAS